MALVVHCQLALETPLLLVVLLPPTRLVLLVVEMFKAHLVMIQRKSANPYARKTEKGPRPGGAVKAPVYSSLVLVRSSSTLG